VTKVDLIELVVTIMAIIIACNHIFHVVNTRTSAVVWKQTVT